MAEKLHLGVDGFIREELFKIYYPITHENIIHEKNIPRNPLRVLRLTFLILSLEACPNAHWT